MTIDARTLRISALAGQPWAITDRVFAAGLDVLRRAAAGELPRSADLRARAVTDRFGKALVSAAASFGPRAEPGGFALGVPGSRHARVACVHVSGVLMRNRADVTDSEGNVFGTAYEDIVAGVEAAMASPSADAVIMVIDSPGGLASPCADVCGRIRAAKAAAAKPLYAMGVDMLCSAALYIAAAADAIAVMPGTDCGCIGTICMVPSYTEANRAMGVSIEVFKSRGAEAKDPMNPERERTDADRAQIQSQVDTLGEQFYEALALGRNVPRERVLQWAARSVWIGADAVAAGLADAVAISLGDAIDQFARLGRSDRPGAGPDEPIRHIPDPPTPVAPPTPAPSGAAAAPKKGTHAMTLEELLKAEGGAALVAQIKASAAAEAKSTPTPTPTPPASIADLKAAFADDPAFALDCAEKGMSLVEAKAARAGVLAARLADAIKARAEADARAADAAKALSDRESIVSKLRAAGVSAGSTGVRFVPEGAAAGASAGGPPGSTETEREYLGLVAQIKAERKCDEMAARGVAARVNPDLHRRYCEESADSIRRHAARIGAVGRPAVGV